MFTILNPPKVSIVITNYNYAHFIEEAIESALNQTYLSVEVVIVDDGSTDHSRKIIALYATRAKIVLQTHIGAHWASINSGFRSCSGSVICFLDADDKFLPSKVEMVMELFDQHPKVEWCSHSVEVMNYDLTRRTRIHPQCPSQHCDFRNAIKRGALPFYFPPTAGLCFRRSLLDRILPMPCIPYAPDNYLKIMISALGQGAHLNIALAKQRIHGNNTYTDRPDHPVKRRLASLYISIEIKKRWPQLGNFAKKKASRTIADIWFNRPVLGKEADLIKTFFLASSFSERLEVRLRSTIILLKQIVRKFLQA